MRILFLTLMLLSHSAFGAGEGGGEEFERCMIDQEQQSAQELQQQKAEEMEQLIQQHNRLKELSRKEQVKSLFLHMNGTLRQMEEDRIYLSGRLASILSHSAFGDEDIGDCTLSPFYQAVEVGNIPSVDNFLQLGEEINQRDEDGATPLIIAAVAGQYAMCRHLILRGANLGARTHDGWNIGTILCRLRHGS